MTESLIVLTGETRSLSVRRLQSKLTSQNSRNVNIRINIRIRWTQMDSPVAQSAKVTVGGAGVRLRSHVRLRTAHTTQPVRRYAVTPLYGEISAVITVIMLKV